MKLNFYLNQNLFRSDYDKNTNNSENVNFTSSTKKEKRKKKVFD